MGAMGAAHQAVIFTESRCTQGLPGALEAHGYAGKVTSSAVATRGLHPPASTSAGLAHYTGSDRDRFPAIDRRTALIDHFRQGRNPSRRRS